MVQFALIATVFILSLSFADIRICCSSKVYVVYMGSKKNGSHGEFLDQDHKTLAAVHGGSMKKAGESHVYTYSDGFRGFAAKLTEEQASMMAGMPGVVSVFPNEKRNLHTTHSWDFMGLNSDAAAEIPGLSTENQGNVIIGFIDTGGGHPGAILELEDSEDASWRLYFIVKYYAKTFIAFLLDFYDMITYCKLCLEGCGIYL